MLHDYKVGVAAITEHWSDPVCITNSPTFDVDVDGTYHRLQHPAMAFSTDFQLTLPTCTHTLPLF
jgi:hypothetical protein